MELGERHRWLTGGVCLSPYFNTQTSAFNASKPGYFYGQLLPTRSKLEDRQMWLAAIA